MRTFSSILILVLSFNLAQANEPSSEGIETPTSLTSDQTPAQFSHVISVNWIPMIGLFTNSPGLGLGYQYLFNEHYSLGVSLYYKKHTFKDRYPDEVKMQFINTGVEARYKFSPFSKNGLYGGLGLVSSEVQGNVEMKNLFSGSKTGEASTRFQETLIVPRVGYVWVPNSKRSSSDFSISYDALDEVQYVYGAEVPSSRPAYLEIKSRKIGANFTFVFSFVF